MKQRVMKTSATVLVTLYGMLALTSSMTAIQTLETELLLTNNFGLLLSTQLSELTAVASGMRLVTTTTGLGYAAVVVRHCKHLRLMKLLPPFCSCWFLDAAGVEDSIPART